MKANFTMRMAAGCSILVAVWQTAAMAGGFGGGSFGGSGMHSVSSNSHSSFQPSSPASNFNTASNFKPTSNFNTTSNLKSTSNSKAPSNLKVTPSNTVLKTSNTNSKILSSKNLSKTNIAQTQNLKTAGSGLSKASNANMFKTLPCCPPVGKCYPGQNCWSNWLWYNPWFYGNCGFGNCGFGNCFYDPCCYDTCGFYNWCYGSGSCATPIVLNLATTPSVAVVNQPAVSPVQTPANAASTMTLQLGQSYSIVNDNFGEKSGDLSVQISGLTLPVRIDKWDAQEINFTVPFVGLDKPADGVFQIAGADHNAIKAVPVTVIAATQSNEPVRQGASN